MGFITITKKEFENLEPFIITSCTRESKIFYNYKDESLCFPIDAYDYVILQVLDEDCIQYVNNNPITIGVIDEEDPNIVFEICSIAKDTEKCDEILELVRSKLIPDYGPLEDYVFERY